MKQHYPVLDGLRGTAAILVVGYHLLEAYYPLPKNHPMHHGYLAVDFFFMLSGFVVGYAYDDRWDKMTVWDFFKIRLIRLHPLVILGTIIGAIGFYLDPYTSNMAHAGLLKLIGVTLISFTLLPAPDIRGWGETHPLDGPCWSLLQEYIANVLYATIVRKMSKAALWVLVVVSGAALIKTAIWHHDVDTGWGYATFWVAIVRVMFPFFGGLLLFRTGKRIRIPAAYVVCSLLLLGAFCFPTYSFNGLYEAGAIIFLFPVIIAAGAGGIVNGRWAKLCKFSGRISYPIYVIHYPFIYLYTDWMGAKQPHVRQLVPVVLCLFAVFILLAYVVLKIYDEPVRAWLKEKFLTKKVMG